jgi:hypothetical protein
MKSFTAIFVFFVTFSGSFAHAQVDQEITTDQIRLAGRGLINKKTSETLAIACIDDTATCENMRFVYLNPVTQKAYYIGSIMNWSSFLTQKQIARLAPDEQRNQAIKNIMNGFKRWRKENRGLSQDTRRTIQGGSFMAILAGLGLASTFGTAGLSLVVGLASYPIYLIMTPMITGDINIMRGHQKMESASHDQNGWNWSSHAQPIRAKLFDDLMARFSSHRRSVYQYMNVTNPIRDGAVR